MWSTRVLTLTLCLASLSLSTPSPPKNDYATDADLHVFVSRPDLRPPRFNVQIYNNTQISPGYWFVTPYGDIHDQFTSTSFLPRQVGPHIYDGAGNLVWSGAHLFNGRPAFDFKTATCNGSACMTFVLNEDLERFPYPTGGGVIIDNNFVVKDVFVKRFGRGGMNMHEFTITDKGTELMIISNTTYQDVTNRWDKSHDRHNVSGWVRNNGFQEVDLATRQRVFEWWSLDHVHPSESLVKRPGVLENIQSPWDFFHINSIDKNSDGDYLVSSRFLSSIFKVSGVDGSVIWQLGGRKSSFRMTDGFNFSSQHHARFLHENTTHAIISFFDNAADDDKNTADVSSGVVVLLDLKEWTAALLEKWDRPDHKLSRLRGNVQPLPNHNTFICWGENSRLSEFSPDGNLLLDAHFTSHRFSTYRAFKFNLTAVPSEPPALKSFIYGSDPANCITAVHASWNGATEVASWRFYASEPGPGHSPPDLLGEVDKTGFETVLIVSSSICHVYTDALASNGTVLGSSAIEQSVLPSSWAGVICKLPGVDGPNAATTVGSFGLSSLNMVVVLYCCVFVLLFCLCLTLWKIQRLRLLTHAGKDFGYTPLENIDSVHETVKTID